MDIEKAFDSLDHNFLISTLEKYGFGKKFILWVKILLRDQEPCVINSGTITKYFSLGRDARQGDPILFTGFKNFKNKYINKCGGVVIRYLHETFELCLQHIQLIFNSKGDKYYVKHNIHIYMAMLMPILIPMLRCQCRGFQVKTQLIKIYLYSS